MTREKTSLTRVFYRRLVALYPRAFQERFKESMEQTFDDLCNERKERGKRLSPGFVARVFIETSVGIVREHLVQARNGELMGDSITNLKLAAGIGFLVVLPFLLLDLIFDIAKRLDTFSLRNVTDVIVTFGFLWLGLTVIIFILLPIVRNLRTGNKDVAAPVLTQENAIKNLLTNPRSAGIISVILTLPFVTILLLLLLHIEPSLGPLEPLLKNADPDRPHVLSFLIVLGALLLAVAAGLIARMPVVRTLQAGGSLFAHPANLMITIVILSFIATLMTGLIIDQFPCWIGVPNCD